MSDEDKAVTKRHVQFVVPEEVAEDFDQEAVAKFGLKHGTKTKFFVHLLEHYKQTKSE